MYSNPNPAKALHLFADIQNHLHNGAVKNELSQILKHTQDQEIVDICHRFAEGLDIQLETKFEKLDLDQCRRSVTALANQLKRPKQRFDEIIKIRSTTNPKWIDSVFRSTELLMVELANYIVLLDREHDIHDAAGEVIRIGDLVAVPCKDEEGRDYDHYGVLIPSNKGFRVAHFFTAETVKPTNSLSEKGFGYVHEVPYKSDWLVKSHLPEDISFSQIEARIRNSRQQSKRVWNKLNYNCEHWAREMWSGEAKCTQLENYRAEIRQRRKVEA